MQPTIIPNAIAAQNTQRQKCAHQTHRLMSDSSCVGQSLHIFAYLIAALILCQNIQPFLCCVNSDDEKSWDSPAKRFAAYAFADLSPTPEKREASESEDQSSTLGQPEEIFTTPEHMETPYDEYPMIVPKRAALLLDRLMVALHHALEKDRSNHRISEFYNKQNDNSRSKASNFKDAAAPQEQAEGDGSVPSYNMYSDDDPNANMIMDYDFKDMNAINRATGETLMAKSFQRRANMGMDLGGGGVGDNVALLLAPSSAAVTEEGVSSKTGVSGNGGRSGVRNSVGGRMYWRCYFNAVSCF